MQVKTDRVALVVLAVLWAGSVPGGDGTVIDSVPQVLPKE
jgi:hypothetical protein